MIAHPLLKVLEGEATIADAAERAHPEASNATRMSRADAAAIKWSDEDRLMLIDWASYRDFAHPALKQDE